MAENSTIIFPMPIKHSRKSQVFFTSQYALFDFVNTIYDASVKRIIRMAQYESGSRTPKADLTNNLANVFGISTSALTVPDIDSYNGLMHTLFTLEDLYGFRIDKLDDELCIRLDKGMGINYLTMFDMFSAWQEQAKKFKNGEITKEEYDNWRYNYPESVAFNYHKEK